MGVPASDWVKVDAFLAKVQTTLDDVAKTNDQAWALIPDSIRVMNANSAVSTQRRGRSRQGETP